MNGGNAEESAFRPFRRADFGGRFSLMVPDGLICEQHGPQTDAFHTWYGRFADAAIEATLFVTTTPRNIVNARTGGPMNPGDVSDEDVVALLGHEFPIEDVEHVEHGAIAFNSYDDDDPSDEESDPEDWRNGALRCHVWRYVRLGRGTACLAQVLLMLPLERADTPRLKALLQIFDREVRNARFAEFET